MFHAQNIGHHLNPGRFNLFFCRPEFCLARMIFHDLSKPLLIASPYPVYWNKVTNAGIPDTCSF